MSRIANVRTVNGGEGEMVVLSESASGIIAAWREGGRTIHH